jgi:hypothetical protein
VTIFKPTDEPPQLAGVDLRDWERLCALHAWDFIYVEKAFDGAGFVLDTVRVSKKRWSIWE